MTDAETLALGRRALAAGFATHAPDGCGRLGDDGALWMHSDEADWREGGAGSPVPDFRDPATLGVLEAQVRERIGDPDAYAEPVYYSGSFRVWRVHGGLTTWGESSDRASAWVAALEARP